MHIYKSTNASIRIDPGNPDHHLFNNHGVWWIHYTLYPDEFTAQRVRHSLETCDIKEARTRRDLLFDALFPEHGRKCIEVFFFPNSTQINRINSLARDWLQKPIQCLIDGYNDLARKGLGDDVKEWIRLCAIGRAFEQIFGDPVIRYVDGSLSAPCLVAVQWKERRLIKYFFSKRHQASIFANAQPLDSRRK
jgi:hypothetical protein